MSSCPKKAMQAASATAPTKLPAYTTTQLRRSCPHVMRRAIAAVTMSALPVNSSVPSKMTMISPMGKTAPDTSLVMPVSVSACAAVDELTAPKPMSTPAATPSTNRRQSGEVALPTEADR